MLDTEGHPAIVMAGNQTTQRDENPVQIDWSTGPDVESVMPGSSLSTYLKQITIWGKFPGNHQSSSRRTIKLKV